MTDWPIQDAQNRFSALVDAALNGSPQLVTQKGQPAVVVLAAEEYERLCELDKKRASSFVDHLLAMPQDDGEFERWPLPERPMAALSEEENQRLHNGEASNAPNFVEHLLAIPKASDDDAFELPPRTRDFHPREIDF